MQHELTNATRLDIATPDELASDYKTTVPTALSWFHKGWIPAAVANGRVIRFDRAAVAKALADRANTPAGRTPAPNISA